MINIAVRNSSALQYKFNLSFLAVILNCCIAFVDAEDIADKVEADELGPCIVCAVYNEVGSVEADGKIRQLKLLEIVLPNQKIFTYKKSGVALKFPDNVVVVIGANSSFSFTPKTRKVNIEGTIKLDVSLESSPVQVNTQLASAIIQKGSGMIVKCRADVPFKAAVLNGKANIFLKPKHSIQMESNEVLAIIPNENGVPKAKPLSKDELNLLEFDLSFLP